MAHAEELRERASRLFALALKAREHGDPAYAEDLTALASEAIAQAEVMEREAHAHRPPPDDPQHVSQQQQQPQPDLDKE